MQKEATPKSAPPKKTTGRMDKWEAKTYPVDRWDGKVIEEKPLPTGSSSALRWPHLTFPGHDMAHQVILSARFSFSDASDARNQLVMLNVHVFIGLKLG